MCLLPAAEDSLPAGDSLGSVCGWVPLPAPLPPPCLPSTPLPFPHLTACRLVAQSRSALPLRMLSWGRLVSHLHKPLSPRSPLPNSLRPLLGTGVVCRGEGKQEETQDKGGGSYSCGILGEWDPTPQEGEGGQAILPGKNLNQLSETMPFLCPEPCTGPAHPAKAAFSRPPSGLGHSRSPWQLECTSTHFPGPRTCFTRQPAVWFLHLLYILPKCTFSVRPSLAPLVEIAAAVLIPLLYF